MTTRGAFHRQGPFVESGGRYSPGSATADPPFGECDDRWITLSRHPGSWPVLHLITWMKADRQTSFRSTRSLRSFDSRRRAV